MAKRFRFFAWAGGKSAKQGASDLRKLIGLVAVVACVASGGIVMRHLFWTGAEDPDHQHEVGPHGGVLIAANVGEPHYHVEFVVDGNGRASIFTYGRDTNEPIEVIANAFVAEITAKTKGTTTTVVFRPHGNIGDRPFRTSWFVGRIPPAFSGKELRINIPMLTIRETNAAFAFDFEKGRWPKGSSGSAKTFERQALLTPKGDRYTDKDIAANGRVTASEKYGSVQVTHKMNPDPAVTSCPVSLLQADSRLAWIIAGKERQFCCVSCIIDFLDSLDSSPSKR